MSAVIASAMECECGLFVVVAAAVVLASNIFIDALETAMSSANQAHAQHVQ